MNSTFDDWFEIHWKDAVKTGFYCNRIENGFEITHLLFSQFYVWSEELLSLIQKYFCDCEYVHPYFVKNNELNGVPESRVDFKLSDTVYRIFFHGHPDGGFDRYLAVVDNKGRSVTHLLNEKGDDTLLNLYEKMNSVKDSIFELPDVRLRLLSKGIHANNFATYSKLEKIMIERGYDLYTKEMI